MLENMMRRPRRNRKSQVIRDMVEETQVSVKDLIFPIFLIDGHNKKSEVESMPGIYRLSGDLILKEIEACMNLGIRAFDIFPAVEEQFKDSTATRSYDPDFFYLRTLREIKKAFPEACIMTDVAMDPYSSDGHDGIVKDGKILNDETLEVLGQMALAQADTGIDIIGPSDMIDGRVGYIRNIFDGTGLPDASSRANPAKHAGGFYNTCRHAHYQAPTSGV